MSLTMTPNTLPTQHYHAQLMDKTTRLTKLMAPFSAPVAEIFPSPVSHYRMRAEFRIWHQQDDLYHIIFDQQTKARLRVDQFPAASQLINHLMPILLDELRRNKVLRTKLFQVDYLSTLSGQMMVSLLYHRPLDLVWQQQAETLRDRLREQGFHLHLIGRAAKTKICLDMDAVDECLMIAGQSVIYRQVENSFTQPNAAVNINMLEWALDVTRHCKGDLLELYCGNGNFTLVLARHFNRILATEIAKSSVAATQFNLCVNHIDNVQIVRMSAEELTQAITGVRTFQRLKEIDLTRYQCETIFVDPPRSGLDQATLRLAQSYPRILYISCNPETLCANLHTLHSTHHITRLALFDQFPYTQHIECGVLLEKRHSLP